MVNDMTCALHVLRHVVFCIVQLYSTVCCVLQYSVLCVAVHTFMYSNSMVFHHPLASPL